MKECEKWQIILHLQENPSLKAYQEKAIEAFFPSTIDLVVREIPLDDDDLPKACPYELAQIFNPNFSPG